MSTQDLLSILGGGGARPAGGRSNAAAADAGKTILSFKAGKMTTTLKPNGKYLVAPDPRRGEINLVWTATSTAAGTAGNAAGGRLKVEWKDRRTRTVVDNLPVFPEDDATFERVETGREGDRVYLLQYGTASDRRFFFWMQDKDVDSDEDNCVKVNLFMSDNTEAATAAGTTAGADAARTDPAAASSNVDNAELLRIMQGALGSHAEGDTPSAAEGGATASAGAGQVDALGNILENLGMPQPSGSGEGAAATTAGSTAAAGATATGTLTLADLQGAMAGLATASPPGAAAAASSPGPPLSDLASAEALEESGIMEDPAALKRLTDLLPEGQRTEDKLLENMRSPQVAQCLQRLTQALSSDAGSFNSIIANFQLNPEDGATAMAAGNPIEAFLQCLLKDVEKKEGIKKPKEEASESKEGESGGSEEGKDGEGKDGDVKMDES